MTGYWQFIPIPLPDRDVKHILVSRAKDRIWLGTSGGVATYDGVEAKPPRFASKEAQQSLRVNSLVEAGNDSVIVGTSNDSLWRWAGDEITPLYGSCPRGLGECATGDWALARSDDGTIYVASSRYPPYPAEAMSSLRSVLSERVIPVEASASYLGFAGDALIAVTDKGSIYSVDRNSGKTARFLDLGLPNGTFVRSVSYLRGRMLLATDTSCLAVALSGGSKPTVLADGYCTATYAQEDGTTWLSTDFLYRNDGAGWTRWQPGQGGAIAASAVMEDGLSNVWIGTSTGLWRYFDVSREHRFAGKGAEVSSLANGADGGVVVGLKNGEVWSLSQKLEAARLDLPADPAPPTSSYYLGALVANEPAGNVWALSGAGLFRFDEGHAQRVADYPFPRSENPRAASTLAVSANGRACTGAVWSPKVLCFGQGKWRESAEVMEGNGSAVSALAFDDAETLLAVGVRSITVAQERPAELGPFDPSPFGTNHLFGAIAKTTQVQGALIVASGGWGGTGFLTRSGHEFSDIKRGGSDTREQPYNIRQFASQPALGLLAASDEGLFRWQGTALEGEWVSLRDIDPRLSLPLSGVVSSRDRAFWVASGSSVILVSLPAAAPKIEMTRSPSTPSVDTNAITYQLLIPGLVGLPASKSATLAYDPPITNAESRVRGPKNRLDLLNLSDLTTYRLTATVTDGFLNSGPPTSSSFPVRLPFYRNPYELAAAVLAVLTLAGVLVTRRGPTGFLLRRIGRLKWTTETSDPRFAIEVSDVGSETVRYELDAPSALTPIRLKVDLPSSELNSGPRDVLPYLVSAAEGRPSLIRESFDAAIRRAADLLGEAALPENLRFVTSQFDGGAIDLGLSKSLLWLPLELADDGGGGQVLLRYAIGRSVSAEVLAEAAPPDSSQLRIAVFSPLDDGSTLSLPEAEAEVEAIAAAARTWGAKVIIVPPDASKTDVLDALCSSHIFHYAGHAEFVADTAGRSFLPIKGDRVTAEDVATTLKSKPHRLMLAFINGCGSSREASWERASEVYGFGSAFLNNATYFIGAQWPIGDEFASSFASEFYARLFPPSYSLWWRIVRRDPLVGVPFAEALRLARCHLQQMGPGATQTWSSYVFYGDPTRRLVLR